MIISNNRGFTLIELIVAIGIFSIIMGAVSLSFSKQNANLKNETLISDMNQNVRAALYCMENEIIMAGYDPDDAVTELTEKKQDQPRAEVDAASDANTLILRYISGEDGIDNDGNGQIDDDKELFMKTVTYELDTELASVDSKEIVRIEGTTGTPVAIADNIVDLEFQYIPDLNNLRSVRITILAKTNTPLMNGENVKITYTSPSGNVMGQGEYNDAFKRRMVSTVVKCRNLAL